MINNVILTGHFKGFDNDDKLLLEIDSVNNYQNVKIDIESGLKDKIVNFIKKDDIVAIKGYIGLDSTNNIIIIATKITFLSKKQKGAVMK